jgi:hypothetical protein
MDTVILLVAADPAGNVDVLPVAERRSAAGNRIVEHLGYLCHDGL